MTGSPAIGAPVRIGLAARAALVTTSYVCAAVVVLLTVILLRGLVAPNVLHAALGCIFVISLAAGLEPGTVKAAALAPGGIESVGPTAYLTASAVKALLASPFLAIVWWFADPAIKVDVLIWLPLVAIAGFAATDLRVLLDLRGRHALAVGLKQGSLAGGIALFGAFVASGLPLTWAVGLATIARLALLALVIPARAQPRSARQDWADARGLLSDRRWVELAAVSVIAAAGGSLDRVFGLRLLRPADYSAYYLSYELFTKFWLIPYLLSPILFARQASGERDGAFVRGAWLLTAGAGAAFLLAVALVLRFLPDLLGRLIGASFGAATLGFAAAVVVGSFVQLRIAQLQGSGLSRAAVRGMGLSAVVSIPLFYVSAWQWSAPGLMWALLVKTMIELALVAWAGARVRAD